MPGVVILLELVSALKFFKDDFEIKRVHFTGGEPTLYSNFINILELQKA